MATTIETKRLILRPLLDTDFEAYSAIMTQRAVTRFLGNGQDKSMEDVKNLLERFQQIQKSHGIVLHGLVEKDSLKLVGHCGYLPLSNKKGYELLYALTPTVWGKGYATEAATATINYAKKHYDWDQIFAMVYPKNIASKKVLTKLGFQHKANEKHGNIDIELLVLKLK